MAGRRTPELLDIGNRPGNCWELPPDPASFGANPQHLRTGDR